ncbi:MAG: hypothetical protein IJF25_00140 [Oscillospiraceae bacterium]|nr:hypothetical protein [Oscillospiraceae bacterium]
MPKTEWLALSYTVPTSPSKVRVYVWRRLRTIGAQQLRNGLAILPNTKENLDSFKTLLEKIKELSGDATLIEMDFTDEIENFEMKKRFSLAKEEQLRDALAECSTLLDKLNTAEDAHSRALIERELRRKLQKLGSSASPFKTQAAELEKAAADLFDTLKNLPAEFTAIMKSKKQQ